MTCASHVHNDVPSPCGESDDKCHILQMGFEDKLRYIFVQFNGIHDSYYIGINRLRLYGAEGELSYKVIAVDGLATNPDSAASVTTCGGWWSAAGKDHSLTLELDEDDCLVSFGLWCANPSATPRSVYVCDARAEQPDLCATRNGVRLGCCDIPAAPPPPLVHEVKSGCGKDNDQCQAFLVEGDTPVRYVYVRFLGIHDSFYIGVNRLRLYGADGELMYKVVVADGSTADAHNAAFVGQDGGWWPPCGEQHSLLLNLAENACIKSVGLWCANAGATPREMHIITDLSWTSQAIHVLEQVSTNPAVSLGRRIRNLLKDNSSLLVGLAAGDPDLRQALLGPVFAGTSPQFPLRQDDSLGRLQAQMLCGSCSARELTELQQHFKVHHITGVDWQDFVWPGNELPTMDPTIVSVTSALVEPAESHGDEWLGTQLYIPPGGSVWVSAEDCSDGWRVKVGAHTDDISCQEEWQRWPRVSLDVPIVPGDAINLFTPFGGLLYLVRTCTAAKSSQVVCWGNIVRQPLVSVSRGIDIASINASPGGWMDCEGKHVVLTLPVKSVRTAIAAGANVIEALEFYDELWHCYHRLSPRTDPRPQRIVPDVQTSCGWMHSGYPIMTHFGEIIETNEKHPIPRILDVERLRKEGNWGLFHELGHNMQRSAWTFDGTVEVTVNLFTLWGFNQLCEDCTHRHIETPHEFYQAACPRGTWNTDPFLALRTYAQVLATFGWEPLRITFESYAIEGEVKRDYAKQVCDFVRRWSLAIGYDIRPHWRKWGFQAEVDGNDQELSALEPWSYE